ncbi:MULTISPECIES: LysR family transcriptional regulator [unclassified Janthinobacterium]|uniref:LysR family transcriptional regulator n=1 Tax=unclassified Janthinobacterium TaxID=2610881 RepID=UPI001613129B|nr:MULTISPECIES: LysR family transcriptional regulator [unclassified Janthinobacterium]MBB5609023.1 DNA-binding transcriptional LysR family regulator [Janthinobacterium sp. S3T4]MBB5614246.1 DNA-binding transcriptional LysR family regulator [Janthinobacterium sp. S3M3]
MELRHLRYFVTVAEEGNFTRAALRLHMQQPPLSQQIRALEEELGFALFLRHPKGVDLSPAGKVYLQEARAILDKVKRAGLRAALTASGMEGLVSVGFTSSAVAHPLIPQLLHTHREQRPQVDIRFSEGNAATLTTAVANGRIDLAFLRMPVERPPGLVFHRLLDETMLLVLPAWHVLLAPAAGQEQMPGIRLSALRDEKFILVRKPGAPGMYAALIDACLAAGYTPRIAAEVDNMLTNISLVAAGVGISVAPASMVGFHAHAVRYCRIADSAAGLHAPLTLVVREDNMMPVVAHFIDEAKRLAGLAEYC